MLNLNLVNDQSTNNQEPEFYHNNLPLVLLPDIKDINIIVGANNSRKSRFLRKVLSLEQKILMTSDVDLNELYHMGIGLADQVLELNKNGIGGAIVSMHVFAPENPLGKILAGFFEDIKDSYRVVNAENLSELIRTITKSLLTIYDNQSSANFKKKAEQLEAASGLALYLYNHVHDNGNKLIHVISYPNGPFRHMEPLIPGVNLQEIVPKVSETITVMLSVAKWVKSIKKIISETYKSDNIYIPVLRTSRSLFGTKDDLFLKTIEHQYFNGKIPPKLSVETGLSLYDKIHFARNGSTAERNAFTEFEHFIGLTFFKSKDIHIVAHAVRSGSEKTIRITIPGQKEDVPIYDLGDGIQGIINLLFPIFTAREGDWIFIDEPENHLHPGFQNLFTRTISEHKYLVAKKLRYFINTHSNHILSEAFLSLSDTAIFVFSIRDRNASNISSFDQSDYSTLELLGVMNTSVFVTNCTVWVEGITDRFYIRAYLHAYVESLDANAYRPNEGFDFSFVEYAGKNLVHYDFAKEEGKNIATFFLNANVFLLADSDFDKEKHIKYEQIKRPNFKYYKTNLPEIENLIPENILKAFLLDKLGCDQTSIDELPALSPDAKLGKTFKTVTKNGNPISIEAKFGGTLSSYYKSKLSNYVYEQIMAGQIQWSDLETSKRLKEIIENLYSFIKERNGKL